MNFFKSRRARVNLSVTTLAETVNFPADPKKRVREIFDKVCHMLSVREVWFFGLALLDEGEKVWLKVDKEIRQELKKQMNKDKPNEPIIIHFLVKFYPETVVDELVLPLTQNLFYLQIKDDFLSERLIVDSDVAILLASFIAQVEIGDLDFDDFEPQILAQHLQLFIEKLSEQGVHKLLPDSITKEIKGCNREPITVIFDAFLVNRGMTPEDSKIAFLKDASTKAGNFGVSYYPATRDNMECKQWIGVTPTGINIYNMTSKVEPVEQFAWTDFTDLNFKENRLFMTPQKKKDESRADDLIFQTESANVNQIILELCEYNHDNYITRRQEPSIEVQQMKEAAKEDSQRRQMDRNCLLRERDLRKITEQELQEAAHDLHVMKVNSDKLSDQKQKLEALISSQKEEITLLHITVSDKDNYVDRLRKHLQQLHEQGIEKDRQITQLQEALSNQACKLQADRRARSPDYAYHRSDSSTGSEPSRHPFYINEYIPHAPNLQLSETLNYVSQMKGESDKLSAEIQDVRLQSEKTFNVVRQGLDAHVDGADY